MLPVTSNRASCDLKKIRDPAAEATMSASSVVSLTNPAANQEDLAEEKLTPILLKMPPSYF